MMTTVVMVLLTWMLSELIRPRRSPPPLFSRKRTPDVEADLDDQNPYKIQP